jgi:hypothetical protein
MAAPNPGIHTSQELLAVNDFTIKFWKPQTAFQSLSLSACRMGKVARLWLSFTISQRARVRFPGRARSTKPSIHPGSVNW